MFRWRSVSTAAFNAAIRDGLSEDEASQVAGVAVGHALLAQRDVSSDGKEEA